MMRSSLKYLGLLVCAMLLSAAPALAETLSWRLTEVPPAGYWPVKNDIWLTEQVAQRTNGDMTVKVFPGGSMGFKSPDYLEATGEGLVEMAAIIGSHVAANEQILEMFDLPMFIPWDIPFRKKLMLAMEPDFQKLLADKYNVYMYGFYLIEPRMIHSKEKVASLADLRGVKIRAMGPVEVNFTKAIGATPVPVNWSELYTALQQGMVDGNWAADAPQFATKLHDQTRYVFDVASAGAMITLSVNKDKWEGLPDNVRKVWLDLKDDWFNRQFESAREGYDSGRKLLTDAGVQAIPVTDADRQRIVDAAKPVIDEWQSRLDAPSRRIFEKAKALVEAYHASS